MKKIISTFVGLFASLFMLSSTAHAIEIQVVKSDTGVTAWLVEDHSNPLIAMRFSFKGGSTSDPDEKLGMSDFLSGMLDEGAGDIKSTEFQQIISDLSIKMSFSAKQDRFNGSLQTLTENRDKAFSMLKLALTSPRMDAAPYARMLQQNLVGLKTDKENPRTIVSRAWLKTMVGNHPYARPKTGTEVTLKNITAQDLKDKAKMLFTRDDLLIAVTGDIDAKTLKKLLDDTFGSLPVKSSVPSITDASVNTKAMVQIIDRNMPQSVIQFGQPGIKRLDKDFIPGYIVFHILGSGQFSSRLMEEVREKRGLAYSAYATLFPMDHAGLVLGSTATVNARVGETVKVIRDEFARMQKDGPTQKELDEAVAYLTGAYALRFDTNSKIAGQLLGTMTARSGIDYIKNRNALIRAVTLADVKRVAKRILKADQLTFTIIGKPEGVTATTN